MKTSKLLKGIAKKFKNWKSSKETAIQEQSVSSRAEAKKPLLSKKITIEQQVVTGKSVPAEEEAHEVCDKPVIDDTSTDIKLCNINSEDLQPICKSSEEAQNDSTTVEPTSVDRETNKQTPDSPSPAEPCFDATDKKDKLLMQQRQAIIIGSVGAALLVSSVVAYILKMYAIAVIGGIVGLACVSYALYNALKPGTKLEKVESVSPTTTDLTFQL